MVWIELKIRGSRETAWIRPAAVVAIVEEAGPSTALHLASGSVISIEESAEMVRERISEAGGAV